ncbi:hypothetical protein NDU88_000132 [Pleurodeles waltl]|uniref:Uncharacterized protein n=1 Tax=Pleurodeles waltl TaxID=8319 RepID=A0AAV7UPN1_PLEWA|nr:hypothetical protein NDU88_000132 [Pleurodeles waltl]
MATGVWEGRKGTEGRRRVEANKHKMRTKPWRLEEKKIRRRTAAQRFHPTKEGEDTQRLATFWEDHGQFRYVVRHQRDYGEKGYREIKGGV